MVGCGSMVDFSTLDKHRYWNDIVILNEENNNNKKGTEQWLSMMVLGFIDIHVVRDDYYLQWKPHTHILFLFRTDLMIFKNRETIKTANKHQFFFPFFLLPVLLYWFFSILFAFILTFHSNLNNVILLLWKKPFEIELVVVRLFLLIDDIHESNFTLFLYVCVDGRIEAKANIIFSWNSFFWYLLLVCYFLVPFSLLLRCVCHSIFFVLCSFGVFSVRDPCAMLILKPALFLFGCISLSTIEVLGIYGRQVSSVSVFFLPFWKRRNKKENSNPIFRWKQIRE